MVALGTGTLEAVDGRLAVPAYDRRRVTTGVVHIGVGGFHRAHQAMFHDRLMNDGSALDWGICGVGVLEPDRRMQEALLAQDCLYTLVVKRPGGEYEPRVIGALHEYLFAPDDPEAVIEKLADPGTRIVSLTITEGGYNVGASGEFDAADAAVAADLARAGKAPATVYGLVVEGLSRRRDRGIAPFAVMSCDNLVANGDLARTAFTAYARLRDPALGAWVEESVAFPNSVVDRITPATTDADRAELRERTGVEDRWPVVTEPFSQWVLEDAGGEGWRPPYEDAGVRVVADVRPYELMKLRLLNAGHQAIAYFGRLCGHTFVHEAVQDPLIRAFLLGYLVEEATPTLGGVPAADLEAYRDAILERFANAAIADTLARLATDASDRLPVFLLPVIREQLAAGGEYRRAAAVVASWARFLEGADEAGRPIEIVDRRRDRLMADARRRRDDPTAFIADRELFGTLAEEPGFTSAYRAALTSLDTAGARATLEALA